MALNYQAFKDFLITFLWKKGDQQLIASLDNLIVMGEAKLNRDLDMERRHTSVTLLVTGEREALPPDYYKMRSVVDLDGSLGELRYVTPADLEAQRAATRSAQWLPIYSLENKFIMFCGPTTGGRKTTGPTPPINPQNGDLWFRTTVAPGLYAWVIDPTSSQWVQLTAETAVEEAQSSARPIVVHYQRRIPSFRAEDTSWLADEELDLYVYAVLSETAPFLREDERVQTWAAFYSDALNKVNENSAHEQVRGIANHARLPRQAGVARRR